MLEIEELIKMRNKLSDIFNSDQKGWLKKKSHYLCVAMGGLDTAIQNLTKFEKETT
jgi:hypothetical protein